MSRWLWVGLAACDPSAEGSAPGVSDTGSAADTDRAVGVYDPGDPDPLEDPWFDGWSEAQAALDGPQDWHLRCTAQRMTCVDRVGTAWTGAWVLHGGIRLGRLWDRGVRVAQALGAARAVTDPGVQLDCTFHDDWVGGCSEACPPDTPEGAAVLDPQDGIEAVCSAHPATMAVERAVPDVTGDGVPEVWAFPIAGGAGLALDDGALRDGRTGDTLVPLPVDAPLPPLGVVSTAPGGWPVELALPDLDGDGWGDFFVVTPDGVDVWPSPLRRGDPPRHVPHQGPDDAVVVAIGEADPSRRGPEVVWWGDGDLWLGSLEPGLSARWASRPLPVAVSSVVQDAPEGPRINAPGIGLPFGIGRFEGAEARVVDVTGDGVLDLLHTPASADRLVVAPGPWPFVQEHVLMVNWSTWSGIGPTGGTKTVWFLEGPRGTDLWVEADRTVSRVPLEALVGASGPVGVEGVASLTLDLEPPCGFSHSEGFSTYGAFGFQPVGRPGQADVPVVWGTGHRRLDPCHGPALGCDPFDSSLDDDRSLGAWIVPEGLTGARGWMDLVPWVRGAIPFMGGDGTTGLVTAFDPADLSQGLAIPGQRVTPCVGGW